MPRYDYFCPANEQTITAQHPADTTLRFWAELCYVTGHPIGETDPESPIEKLLSAPAVSVPQSDTDLKAAGFTKLIKRDVGVYENVTATGNEARYFRPGDPDTQPDLARKIED